MVSLAGSAVAAAALLVAPAGIAVAAPAVASPMVLAAGSAPMTLAHAVSLPGGDVSTTWKANGAEVKSAGRPGSRVSLAITGRDSLRAWTAPPSAAAASPQQYARSGRSVYWDALGAGMSKAEAVKITLSLGDRLPAAAHVQAAPKFLTPDIFNSACTTTYGGAPYNIIWGQACLQQSYLESKPGAYYLNNQVETSGSSGYESGVYLSEPLVLLYGNYCWCGNGYTYTRVGWSPSHTYNEGSPTTYTLSAAYDGLGASVSETQYPATLTPIYPSGVNEPAFGSEWQGSNENGIVDDANSVAIVHEGPGAPGPARVVVGITWTQPNPLIRTIPRA
ncbi:MAG: hypothetical protein ABSA03_02615 [Streptosporangiaceae bacterium]